MLIKQPLKAYMVLSVLAATLSGCGDDAANTSVCGDEQITGTEECDGNLLLGETCQTQGYNNGALACDPVTCTFDESMCAAFPDPNRSTLVAGDRHTCTLLDAGAVRCWGHGNAGQLGYGNTNAIGDDELPNSVGEVQISGTALALTAGDYHNCALLNTGAVKCWGDGTFGRLGYGNRNTIGDDELPDSVGEVQIGGTAVALSAGWAHTCALLDTGAVRCWGNSISGQLGYGNTNAIGGDEFPDSVGEVQIGGTAVALSAGGHRTCALLDTGTIRCWGSGSVGQLGYGNTNDIGDDELPDSVGEIQLGGTAVALSAGWGHTCALLDTGAVHCWGGGSVGQLGYGNIDDIGDNELPSSVGAVSLNGIAVAVAAGGSHTCALLETGTVRCWGDGSFGQLGYGNTDNIGDDELPSSVDSVPLGGMAVAVSAGGSHTCALLDTGAIRCWGDGEAGKLGYGNNDNIGDDETPESAGDVPIYAP